MLGEDEIFTGQKYACMLNYSNIGSGSPGAGLELRWYVDEGASLCMQRLFIASDDKEES